MTIQRQPMTDELRNAIVSRYTELMSEYPEDQRPNYTVEVTAAVGEELGCTVNQVRTIVSKAKDADGNSVYVSKAAAKASKPSGAKAATGDGAKRRGKADSHADLIAAIEAMLDPTAVDKELIGKLTGKSADYFTSILLQIQESSDPQ